MSDEIKVTSFYRSLISEGYYFNKEIIENYLLSLKVKPFEILTGNSGTGKTKLSQLFAKFLSDTSEPLKENDNTTEYITVKAKANYSSWKHTGWTLVNDDFKDIFPIKNCEKQCNIYIDGIHAEGRIYILIQLYYDSKEIADYFKVLYEKDDKSIVDLNINCEDIKKMFKDYEETNGSIVLTQNINKTSAKERQWMLNKKIFNYFPFKYGFNECRINVNDMDSTAKFRILPKLVYKPNKKLQSYLKENIGKPAKVELKIDSFNFENFKPEFGYDKTYDIGEINLFDFYNDSSKYQIVPVGANWTDNTNILGYHNAITNNYQSTPAYKLIEQAQNDPINPYFLILDEMNLSHVERYFADFLSAIESGEEIPLYGIDDSLKLPDNLFIIGTVNVDETTYMFSPKVLDRANTIEFDTIDADYYMSSEVNNDDFTGDIMYLQSPLIDSYISKMNIKELREIFLDIETNDGMLWDILSQELTKFQEILKGSGFDFGFRVINEILRFMVVAWKYEHSPDVWNNWSRYFDAQIKQKILPKLHGSEKAIGNVLINLFNACLDDKNANENPKNFKVTYDNARYYTSALKLQNMSKVLSEQRYVSFIN